MRPAVYMSILAVVVLLSFVSFIFFFTIGDSRDDLYLILNTTCKHENLTGICKSKDSCQNSLTSVKLEPCIEGDLSVVCCPIEEIPIPKGQVETEKNVVKDSNRTKRTPGEKAKEMCKKYASDSRLLKKPIGSYSEGNTICEVEREPLKLGEANAKEKEFPHMAQIGNIGKDSKVIWVCGGSLVSRNFILSAAHCSINKNDSCAMIGSNKWEDDTDFFLNNIFFIIDIFIHPKYNATDYSNDIALFKIATGIIPVRPYTRPACLDTGSPHSNDIMEITTSFGVSKETTSKDILKKVILSMVDVEVCAAKYNQYFLQYLIHHESTLCAYSNVTDICEDVFGGPLQIYHRELPCMYTVTGITSYSVNCSAPDLPSVYTKISPYTEWIEDIIWPE